MRQLTSKAKAHNTLCVIPRDTNILSLRVWNADSALLRQPLMSRWREKKKHSTKLIYPLEQNVSIRYMPKGIYYFNVPLWLDDVRILILEPCCTLKSANLIGKSPPLIKHCLLFVVVAFLICAWKEGCGKHFLQQLLFCCKNLFLHWDKKKRGWNIVLMPRCVMPY